MACKQVFYYLFQSTLSVRRATGDTTYVEISQDISIHALREESDMFGLNIKCKIKDISIHALREESDCLALFCMTVL